MILCAEELMVGAAHLGQAVKNTGFRRQRSETIDRGGLILLLTDNDSDDDQE